MHGCSVESNRGVDGLLERIHKFLGGGDCPLLLVIGGRGLETTNEGADSNLLPLYSRVGICEGKLQVPIYRKGLVIRLAENRRSTVVKEFAVIGLSEAGELAAATPEADTEGASMDKSIIKLARCPTRPCDWGKSALDRAPGKELTTGGSPEPDASRILIMRSKPVESAPQGLCGAKHEDVDGNAGRFDGGDGVLEYWTMRQRVIWATSWPKL